MHDDWCQLGTASPTGVSHISSSTGERIPDGLQSAHTKIGCLPVRCLKSASTMRVDIASLDKLAVTCDQTKVKQAVR